MNELRFWKRVVILNAALPLLILAWDAYDGNLGANAVNFAIHTTGFFSLLFLIFSLMVTPLRWLTGWNSVVGIRRALGLFAFVYAVAHLAIYFTFDRSASITSTVSEIFLRPFLAIGFIALLLMVPLAITSTSGMIARMGPKSWKLLHRLAYVVAALGVLHFYLLVKADVEEPLMYGGFLGLLLGARVVWPYFDLSRKKSTVARRASDVGNSISTVAATGSGKKKPWTGELRVVSITPETPSVSTFRLAALGGGELPFEHQPGQFLSLQLSIDGKRVRRSYTIASSPLERSYCELTIKRESQGFVSRHLHDQLQVGDTLTVTAPAGKFVFTGKEAAGVILIAGGVGITPLMSMARYLTKQQWSGTIEFLIVAKSQEELIFREEIEQIQREFPRLRVHITLSQAMEGDTWSGSRGRATPDWLVSCAPQCREWPIYLCGPDAMMAQTRELLVGLRVASEKIHTEAFSASRSSQPMVEMPASPMVPLEDAPVEVKVNFTRSKVRGAMQQQATVLEAAESLGLDLPYECRSGVCGQCKVRLVAGDVTMEAEHALSKSDKSMGWILACQAQPAGDIEIEA